MTDTELASGTVEQPGAISGAVVGHRTLDCDAVFSEELHGSDKELSTGILALVVLHLGVRNAAVIIGRNVGMLPSGTLDGARSIAMDAMAGLDDAGQLLRVQVQQLPTSAWAMGGYSGTGDYTNAQTDDTLLGKMIRIDGSGGLGSGYSVPLDNPHVGTTPLDEIWAHGFRNPHRWSFDRLTGDIYIADVGQGSWEEDDVEPSGDAGGNNHGWPRMEGNACHGSATGCNGGSLTLPVHAYDHLGGRCSITGGYVYRGEIESIEGRYFFADYCSGQVWSSVWNGSDGVYLLRDGTSELTPSSGGIGRASGFGEDGFGELCIVDRGNAAANGEVFKMVARNLPTFEGETS